VKNLIIGCGRSGTTFVAKYLQSLGLDVGHENYIGENGVVSWYLTFGERHSFDHVIHIIRNPYDSFKSYPTFTTDVWKYVCDNIPEIKIDDSDETKFVKYWCLWNKKAEEVSEVTIKVEELRSKIPMLLDFFGMKESGNEESLYEKLLKERINTRSDDKLYGFDLTFDEEDAKMLEEYCECFGYSIRNISDDNPLFKTSHVCDSECDGKQLGPCLPPEYKLEIDLTKQV
jgi:hypothetical protein